MSQEYATFTIFQALDLVQNTSATAVRKIESGANIQLVYCIPKKFSKRRTDVSGAETEAEAKPDTGPASAFVEIMFTADRGAAQQQTILDTLLQWYRLRNTALPFRRGFLGLENEDNPSLDLDPEQFLGYKLADFQIVDPIDFKGLQKWVVTLEFGGNTNDLPVFP